MKWRRYLLAGACALVSAGPGLSSAAPVGVGVPGTNVAPAANVAPATNIAPQSVNAPLGKTSAPVRTVTAPTLVDQSRDEEAALDTAARPVVAGEGAGHADGAEAEQEVAVAPVQEPKRAWLRQSRTSEPDKAEPASSSNWSMSVLAFVLLGGLAGAAVVLKMRRGGPAPWSPPAAVRVLTTTRLTPKASLLTAEVHGRVLLLGVTDSSVTELGWLDGNPSAERSLQTGERELDDEHEDGHTPLPSKSNLSRAGFGQVLGNVFRAGERKSQDVEFRGNPNVAALIAARDTRDVVSTSQARAARGDRRVSSVEQESPHVETQVAGLLRRRR